MLTHRSLLWNGKGFHISFQLTLYFTLCPTRKRQAPISRCEGPQNAPSWCPFGLNVHQYENNSENDGVPFRIWLCPPHRSAHTRSNRLLYPAVVQYGVLSAGDFRRRGKALSRAFCVLSLSVTAPVPRRFLRTTLACAHSVHIRVTFVDCCACTTKTILFYMLIPSLYGYH